jgi:uncharacterized repeat protein (TIGR01451 family)
VDSYVVNEGAAHSGTLAGAPGSALADLPPCALQAKPPDEDFSDRLVPGGVGGRAALANMLGSPVATQAGDRTFKSLFLAFDAAYLSDVCSTALMMEALEWFSPLGDSALSLIPTDRRAFASGDQLMLRLELRNSGPTSLDGVRVRWSVPSGATLDESRLPARWSWHPDARLLLWTGDLARNQSLLPAPELTLTLDDNLPEHHAMASEALMSADGITLTRRAEWRVNSPDLGESTKSVPDERRVLEPGQTASFVIHVRNTGTLPASRFALTDTLPAGLVLDPASVLVDRGTQPDTSRVPGSILWSAEVEPGRVASLSYRARVSTTMGGWLRNRAVVDDGTGGRIELSAAVFAKPRLFVPWVAAQVGSDP